MTNRIINLWFVHVLQVHWHTINDMIDRCCECWVCAPMCVRTICCIIHFYTVCNDTFIGSTLFASLLAHLISSALYSTRFTWAIFKKKEPSLQCVAFYKFSQHVLVHSKTKLNVSILCLLFQLKILNIKLTECLCVCVCLCVWQRSAATVALCLFICCRCQQCVCALLCVVLICFSSSKTAEKKEHVAVYLSLYLSLLSLFIFSQSENFTFRPSQARPHLLF